MTAALRVLSPGLMTTIQDQGRTGFQSLGVPVSGALDRISLAAANILVGNAPGTAAFEIAYQGPTFVVEAESARVAFAGAEPAIEVLPANGEGPRRPQALESIRLVRGDTLKVGAFNGSAVGYLAVEGGLGVPAVLGSRATLVRAGIGGLDGRALRAGDSVPLAREAASEREEQRLPDFSVPRPDRFRVVLGPQDDYFTPEAIDTLLSATYTATQSTDRMGMRLDGPPLAHALGSDIVSDGIAPGTIQVPGNGLPIILLADRQTTGGYPKIATVISADLPALGRLRPGATLSFSAVTVEEAQALRRRQEAELAALATSLAPVVRLFLPDTEKLLSHNLVSGAVDARD